jgi:hypothetical protein
MPTETITATFRNPFTNAVTPNVAVTVASTRVYKDSTTVYPLRGKPVKVEAGILNPSIPGVQVAVATSTTEQFVFSINDSPVTVSVIQGNIIPPYLENLLAGAFALTGTTATITGTIYDPIGNTAWDDGQVTVTLERIFSTAGGVYIPDTITKKITSLGAIDGDITIITPDAAALYKAYYKLKLPDGSEYDIFHRGSGVLDVSDIITGMYATE